VRLATASRAGRRGAVEPSGPPLHLRTDP